jgi:hypothetical protein
MISPIRGNRTDMGVQVPSDTVIPYIRPFLGTLDRHPRAGCRQRQAIGVSCSLSFLVRALQPG